ncbi:GIY-YIG nuclease family protein, partial [bacterium]|nr:GIY-YIG nuclease family protein [bacterium]MBU1875146.1 GIY-YIG nuclease family protein [bacterium]
MSYFTYILQSGLDQSFYIGYTANIKKRLEEHNNGESRYTKRKIPWKLVHLE